MERTRRPRSPQKGSDNELVAPERPQEIFAANLKETHSAAERLVKENDALKRDHERQYILLCSEHAALQHELQSLRQRLDTVESERDVKTRLIQQQAAQISRMGRELVERNTDTELVQKLLQSASWRITAPLRAAKLIVTRVVASMRG